jgi:hypothetical protein
MVSSPPSLPPSARASGLAPSSSREHRRPPHPPLCEATGSSSYSQDDTVFHASISNSGATEIQTFIYSLLLTRDPAWPPSPAGQACDSSSSPSPTARARDFFFLASLAARPHPTPRPPRHLRPMVPASFAPPRLLATASASSHC